jgi:hypothetical protein
MECDCKDWKENRPIIDGALFLYYQHGGSSLKKAFIYCPYCNKKLKEEKKHG